MPSTGRWPQPAADGAGRGGSAQPASGTGGTARAIPGAGSSARPASGRGCSPQPASGGTANGRWPLGLAGLSALGAVLSGYLWQAKVGAAELVCGPLGDCHTVNASAFSEIMGVPIALLGMLMYLGLTGALLTVWRWPNTVLSQFGFALALAGAIFSLYLTFVEAFVLRAYCIWCLISWGLITVIAWTWGRALRRVAT